MLFSGFSVMLKQKWLYIKDIKPLCNRGLTKVVRLISVNEYRTRQSFYRVRRSDFGLLAFSKCDQRFRVNNQRFGQFLGE